MTDNTKALAAIDKRLEKITPVYDLAKKSALFSMSDQAHLEIDVLALQAAKALLENDWKPIDSAPENTPVRVKVDDMEFTATLTGGFIDSDDEDVSGWAALKDGQHPDCWHDGICWRSNADEMQSLQPTHWKPLDSDNKALEILSKIGGDDGR